MALSGLVSYTASDSEGSENEEGGDVPSIPVISKPPPHSSIADVAELPLDDTVALRPWELQERQKPKKERRRIQIKLPELQTGSDEDSDNEDVSCAVGPKRPKIEKKSGLLGKLPPPVEKSSFGGRSRPSVGTISSSTESTTFFKPASLRKPKPARTTTTTSMPPTSSSVPDVPTDDVPSRVPPQNFFDSSSYAADDEEDVLPVPADVSSVNQNEYEVTSAHHSTYSTETYTVEPGPSQPPAPLPNDLDVDALLSTLPADVSRSLRKDPVALNHFLSEQIAPAHAHQAKQGNSREQLLRNLSAEAHTRELRAELKKKQQPTGVAKSRHHISWLAYHAQEREADLKQEWAASAMNRRQTQQKYGFC